MEKSIYSEEYAQVADLLRQLREKSAITQIELAKKLGKSQSFVSKMERGERLLDVIQLRHVCQTLGITLPDFVQSLEKLLAKH